MSSHFVPSHGQAGTALFNSSSPAVDLVLLLFSTTFHIGVNRLLVYHFDTTLFAALPLVAINQQLTNQPTNAKLLLLLFYPRIASNIKETSTISVAFSLASTSTLHCGLLLSSALTRLASHVTELRLMKTPIRYSASPPTETSRVFPIQEARPPRQGNSHQQTPTLTHTDSPTSLYA